MDTWWKKLIYSSWLKGIAVLGFFLVGFLAFFSFLSIQVTPKQNSVYDTYYLNEAFIQKAGYVRDYIVRYRNEAIIDTITEVDIQKYKEAHGEALTDEEAKNMIIKDRQNYLMSIDNAINKNNVNVDFYAKSLKDNTVLTNMDTSLGEENIIQDLTSREVYLVGDGHYIYDRSYYLGLYDSDGFYNGVNVNAYGIYESSNSTITHQDYYTGEGFDDEGQYKIYVALKQPLEAGDAFYAYERNFENVQKLKGITYKMIAYATLIGTILVIYWVIAVGGDSKKEGISMKGFDRIPFEFQLIGLAISTIVFVMVIQIIDSYADLYSCMPYVGTRTAPQSLIVAVLIFVVISAYTGIGLAVVSSLIKHIKNKSLKEYIGVIRFSKQLKNYLLTERKLTTVIVIILGVNAVAIVIIILGTLALESFGVLFILTLAWSGVLAFGIFKVVFDYRRILEGTKAIASGDLNHKIHLEKALPVLVDLADTINTMGTGLEKAVEHSVKSERLKAELITNVSHDLKTPLTSIISYIDLLKAEEINNETAKEYIGVLDERSGRLKQLVEDLVEASKAVTGNIEAKLEPFMLDELVLQAVGEYTDRLEAQGLQLITSQIKSVKVLGDSRHMWRVVENLLSNVSKYALPHTRAYIEVLNEGEYGIFIIKNISKDALNINPNELTERFVRGDASRTTEGSGLGLAIAQSLMHLQAGQMAISIDGDLFKVEVKIPAIKDTVSLNKK